jgi:hypothetical protein
LQGSFSPAMPKKKRAAVATHRAKKKKIEQSETVEEEPESEDEEESDEEEASNSSEPPSPTSARCDDLARQLREAEELNERLEEMAEETARLRSTRDAAFNALAIVQRRWQKTFNSYFIEHPMLRWETRSELQRGLDRMRSIDEEKAAAEAHAHACANELECYQTWAKLVDEDADDGVVEAAQALATARENRAAAHDPAPPTPPVHDNDAQLKCLLLMSKYVGMAQAFQWVHLADLRRDI